MKAFNQWQSNISSQWDLKTLQFINLWFNAAFFQSVALSHYKRQKKQAIKSTISCIKCCIRASFICLLVWLKHTNPVPVLQVNCERITAGCLADTIFTSLFLFWPFFFLHSQFTYYIFHSYKISVKYENHNVFQSSWIQ